MASNLHRVRKTKRKENIVLAEWEASFQCFQSSARSRRFAADCLWKQIGGGGKRWPPCVALITAGLMNLPSVSFSRLHLIRLVLLLKNVFIALFMLFCWCKMHCGHFIWEEITAIFSQISLAILDIASAGREGIVALPSSSYVRNFLLFL